MSLKRFKKDNELYLNKNEELVTFPLTNLDLSS